MFEKEGSRWKGENEPKAAPQMFIVAQTIDEDSRAVNVRVPVNYSSEGPAGRCLTTFGGRHRPPRATGLRVPRPGRRCLRQPSGCPRRRHGPRSGDRHGLRCGCASGCGRGAAGPASRRLRPRGCRAAPGPRRRAGGAAASESGWSRAAAAPAPLRRRPRRGSRPPPPPHPRDCRGCRGRRCAPRARHRGPHGRRRELRPLPPTSRLQPRAPPAPRPAARPAPPCRRPPRACNRRQCQRRS